MMLSLLMTQAFLVQITFLILFEVFTKVTLTEPKKRKCDFPKRLHTQTYSQKPIFLSFPNPITDLATSNYNKTQ